MTEEMMENLFSTDKDLLDLYHIEAPASAKKCAERTFKDMKEAGCEIHLIERNNEVIGYYGIEGQSFLTGFFLKPEHRTSSMLEYFWKRVEKHFNDTFMVGVYKKNTRAIKFLDKKTNNKYEIENIVLFTVKR